MNKDKKGIWQFPWKYKESIAIVIGILLIGVGLQLITGPFNFFLLHFPNNVFVGIALILVLIALAFVRKTNFFKWFSGVHLSVTAIVAMLIITLIMGLTPQVIKVHPHDANIFTQLGFTQMTSSWPFVLIYGLIILNLGALIVRRLIAFKISDYAFYLNHIGLWILLTAGGLGAADMNRYVMHIYEGEMEWQVYDSEGEPLELPIAIHLNEFIMEEYPPKITVIDRESGKIQPENLPEFYQIDEKRPSGNVAHWNITMDEYIHNAIRNSDSTYNEVHMPGSCPAAKVTVTNTITGDVKQGWVAGGNMAQLFMTLELDSAYTTVMTEPEPKRFASDIIVFTEDGEEIHTTIEVNKALKIGHWTLYQYGYDSDAGKMSNYSSIELVYDPWLNLVYAGIFLLGLGSICLIWSGNKRRQKIKEGGEDDLE